MSDPIFQPLAFRNLTVKNRVFRSNVSGRFDNYDGFGTQARINWEVKFARGGVGAIISSFVPVTIRGRIMPNYTTVDADERIPFWRAREAGLDGVELHGANGYLITQFLSSAIRDRKDEYGGTLKNRARFLLDIVRAIRAKVGRDFHLQVKISATEHNDALSARKRAGNTTRNTRRVCQWLEADGVDAIHVSTGSFCQR